MDKRIGSRIPLAMEVTYKSGDDFISSFLSDISGGGVFIEASKPLEVSTRLRVCFHVPGVSESLLVTGTVVWVRDPGGSYKPGMGFRFDEMEPQDREKLDLFLADH